MGRLNFSKTEIPAKQCGHNGNRHSLGYSLFFFLLFFGEGGGGGGSLLARQKTIIRI